MELNGLKGRCGVPLEGHWFLMRYYAEMVRVCMQTGRPALRTIAVNFVLFLLRWQDTNYNVIKSTLEPQPGVPRVIEGENKLSGGPCPLDGRGLQCPLHQIYPELHTAENWSTRQHPRRDFVNSKGVSKLEHQHYSPISKARHNYFWKYIDILVKQLSSLKHCLPEFIEKYHPTVFKGI